MSPIEVMARAICRTVLARLVASDRLDAVVNEEWHGHVLEATVALLALSQMEPTPGMVEAGTMEHFGTKRGDYHYEGGDARSVEAIFRAMLAAAVKEG